MTRSYYVEATVTYSGYFRARSKQEAVWAAEATSGKAPMDIVDIDFMVIDPRDTSYPKPSPQETDR